MAHEHNDEQEMNEAGRAGILVVDDYENTRRSASTVLEEEGCEVSVAASGDEAVAKFKMNFRGLALVYLRLPDMDDTRLLTEVKETVRGMVKIIITGYPSFENAIEAVNRGVNNGVNSCIVRPYDIGGLLHRIEKSLERQRETKKYNEAPVNNYMETCFKEVATIG